LENSTSSFYTLSASDSDGDTIATVELLNAADGAFFAIDSQSLQISPSAAFDFETANDSNADNIYNVNIRVTDSRGAATTFSLAVEVEDVSDNFSYGLQAGLPPSGNFELIDWKMDLPISDSGALTGDSAKIDEDEMAAGYTNSEYFFTAADGGMVMRAPSRGATTSANTRYTRTELREMLRRGDRSISTRGAGGRPNANNWTFSSAPQSALDDAGGIDGELMVTMAVNEVTTTGENFQIGRVVIGQIHAKDDEPLRLYYRKLPENRRGSIYAAHEINGGDDVYYEIIGSRDNDASNPADGILLGETFTYNVNVVGNSMDVTVTKANGDVFTRNIDMTNSGYDIEDDFMYFKVGVYHLNDTADDGEFAQVTIYELENSHQGYPF
jgi:poly(beta-D-mannuronate) lyase